MVLLVAGAAADCRLSAGHFGGQVQVVVVSPQWRQTRGPGTTMYRLPVRTTNEESKGTLFLVAEAACWCLCCFGSASGSFYWHLLRVLLPSLFELSVLVC